MYSTVEQIQLNWQCELHRKCKTQHGTAWGMCYHW